MRALNQCWFDVAPSPIHVKRTGLYTRCVQDVETMLADGPILQYWHNVLCWLVQLSMSTGQRKRYTVRD